jgi:hypothetical protein
LKKALLFLITVILVAILAGGLIQIVISQYGEQNTAPMTGEVKPHFSVKWMGFAPDSNTTWPSVQPYNNNYSEYFVCINDVISDKLSLPVSFRLANHENSAFYFRVNPKLPLPTGWSTPTNEIGLVNKDETRFFTITTERVKPSLILAGKLAETITLTVQAYYDSSYTQFYSQDDVPVTFNFIDRTASAWSVLSTDNFDTPKQTQWDSLTNYGSVSVVGDIYRSYPRSLRITNQASNYDNGFGSTIAVNSSYAEAYIIASIKTSTWSTTPRVTFNGTVYFEPDVSPTQYSWYQLVFPLPINQTTQVGIYLVPPIYYDTAYGYLDDVYVIAKPT